jgi:hypothetical protein
VIDNFLDEEHQDVAHILQGFKQLSLTRFNCFYSIAFDMGLYIRVPDLETFDFVGVEGVAVEFNLD